MLRENVGRGLIVLTAFAVGIARPFLTSHPLTAEGSYEAFAHLLVGGLIGAWLVKRERVYLGLVVGLSTMELASAEPHGSWGGLTMTKKPRQFHH